MAESISLDQYQALKEASGFVRRDERGRITLRGADRKGYLHGLLSNDILALEPGSWCYATLLTAQGRMISDMRVFDLGDLLLLDLERSRAAPVAEHLDNFVISEDVVVHDMTTAWTQIGVYGPLARKTVEEASLRKAVLFLLPSSDLGVDGVDLIVLPEAAEDLERTLEKAGSVRVDWTTLEVTRVEAGIPRFSVDMDTTTIPLEAGIEDRAISMTKGCYVGQEVIVRVLHRGGGRVAKKLVSLDLQGLAGPGDRIFAGDREIGRITSAVDSPRYRRWIALGYVQRDFAEPGTSLAVRTAGDELSAVVVQRAM